jgi:hypothetical protein
MQNDGNDLHGMILTEAGRGESTNILIVKTPARFFDHPSCQGR